MENQAIGRAVRLGQDKEVVIKRFIMKNTIEEYYFNENKIGENISNILHS
jgi:SNF2 family DNA or RNA helicase